MKRFLTLALAFSIATLAGAVPAKRTTKTLTLADGSTIEATLTGDESNHYWLSADNIKYEEDADGFFKEISSDASATRAQRAKAMTTENTQRRSQRLAANSLTGNKRGIVILVNFSDKSMANSQSDFDNAFNQEGYSENGSAGSVRDYFLSQSYNKLTIDFDVVGPVTVSRSMQYYGQNDSDGNDKYPATMVIEALKLVDSEVDFSKYDWDGDGYVDQVYVIYAGYGEAQGASENTIWPHEWSLYAANYYGDGEGSQTLDGVIIDTYACSNELIGTSGSQMDGIGTACHEFSHCLGLPDMYDTNSVNYGMGSWDLLDYGCYNGNGYVPAGYTSYERMFAGWLTPTEISEYSEISGMQALTDSPEAYIIYNQNVKTEYYLLENRQKSGFDASLPASGLLVLHVDYDEEAWTSNTLNNTVNHERMTIIPADGLKSMTTETKDPWPQTNATELTNSSTPGATLYNYNSDGTKYMNMPIRSIAMSNGLISFTVGDKVIDAPVADDATDITRSSFTANWQAVEDATGYRVVLSATSEAKENTTVLSEDFSNLTASTDGSSDLAEDLDDYTQQSGWTGLKVFKGAKGVKLGTSKVKGYLTTPVVDANGTTTIEITAQKFNSSSTTLTVTDADDNTIGIITLTSDAATTTLTTEASGSLQIKITAASRAYLSGLSIVSTAASKTTQTVETEDLSYTFTGLDNSLSYSYVVYALTGDVASIASNSISVTLPTAIQSIKAENQETAPAIYDLSGRRIQKPRRGVYIQGGKKYVN